MCGVALDCSCKVTGVAVWMIKTREIKILHVILSPLHSWPINVKWLWMLEIRCKKVTEAVRFNSDVATIWKELIWDVMNLVMVATRVCTNNHLKASLFFEVLKCLSIWKSLLATLSKLIKSPPEGTFFFVASCFFQHTENMVNIAVPLD